MDGVRFGHFQYDGVREGHDGFQPMDGVDHAAKSFQRLKPYVWGRGFSVPLPDAFFENVHAVNALKRRFMGHTYIAYWGKLSNAMFHNFFPLLPDSLEELDLRGNAFVLNEYFYHLLALVARAYPRLKRVAFDDYLFAKENQPVGVQSFQRYIADLGWLLVRPEE